MDADESVVRDSLGAVPESMNGGETKWLQFTANAAPMRAAFATNLGIGGREAKFQTMK